MGKKWSFSVSVFSILSQNPFESSEATWDTFSHINYVKQALQIFRWYTWYNLYFSGQINSLHRRTKVRRSVWTDSQAWVNGMKSESSAASNSCTQTVSIWICTVAFVDTLTCFCLILFLGTGTENQAVMFPIMVGFGKAFSVFSVDESLEAFVLTGGRGYTELWGGRTGSSELVIWTGWGLLFYSHDCLTVRNEQLPDLDKKLRYENN